MLGLVSAGGLAAFLQSTSDQEGSGSSRAAPPRATRPQTPDEFYASFWQHLVRKESPYNKWNSFPGKGDLHEAQSPHGDFVKTFVSKSALEKPGTFPIGSIIVTENYDKDKKLRDITVMYRVKGTEPNTGDWYWLKYLPNGAIARTPEKEGKKPIAGKVASCIECHSKAGGKDLVYSNDPEPEADKK
jgi:hypothetical protein